MAVENDWKNSKNLFEKEANHSLVGGETLRRVLQSFDLIKISFYFGFRRRSVDDPLEHAPYRDSRPLIGGRWRHYDVIIDRSPIRGPSSVWRHSDT